MRIDQGDGITSVVAVQDGNLITGTVQDCTPILERTQAMNREGHHGSSDMKLAASLPMVVVERYCNNNGITFEQFMQGREHIKRMLNDPDLSYFRIWPGKV